MLSKAKCLLMLLTYICSRVLQQMHVSYSSIIFSPFLKTGETLACRKSSGTSPRAKDSLKISASIGEISLKISARIGEFALLHSHSPSLSIGRIKYEIKGCFVVFLNSFKFKKFIY